MEQPSVCRGLSFWEWERGMPVDDGVLISCVGKGGKGPERGTDIGFGPGFFLGG